MYIPYNILHSWRVFSFYIYVHSRKHTHTHIDHFSLFVKWFSEINHKVFWYTLKFTQFYIIALLYLYIYKINTSKEHMKLDQWERERESDGICGRITECVTYTKTASHLSSPAEWTKYANTEPRNVNAKRRCKTPYSNMLFRIVYVDALTEHHIA